MSALDTHPDSVTFDLCNLRQTPTAPLSLSALSPRRCGDSRLCSSSFTVRQPSQQQDPQSARQPGCNEQTEGPALTLTLMDFYSSGARCRPHGLNSHGDQQQESESSSPFLYEKRDQMRETDDQEGTKLVVWSSLTVGQWKVGLTGGDFRLFESWSELNLSVESCKTCADASIQYTNVC